MRAPLVVLIGLGMCVYCAEPTDGIPLRMRRISQQPACAGLCVISYLDGLIIVLARGPPISSSLFTNSCMRVH